MYDFGKQNSNLLLLCEIVLCGFRVIGGDITCTSNILKLDPVIMIFTYFVQTIFG